MNKVTLTPEEAELHRQRVLRLEERITYLKQLGYVYLLISLLSIIIAVAFASMPAPHITRAMLSGLFLVFTIISAISWFRTNRERRMLEERYVKALFSLE